MKNLLFVFIFAIFFYEPSFAYIPRAKTIIKKMASNNGRNLYKIVREVTLSDSDNSFKARETWVVANGDKMKLQVESLDPKQAWSFVIVYDKGKRKTLSSSKKIKSFSRSKEFFEPLFHDRYHRSLMKRLVSFRFLPSWSLTAPEPEFDEGKTKMTAEPFVRLEPISGSINYALGSKKDSSGEPGKTTLWIEQDSFVIKKGRLRSKSEFVNNQFQSFPGGLKLPREQIISWGNKTATIKLLAAETVSKNKKLWSLTNKRSSQIPDQKLIKEFYSRFR